MNGPEQAGGTAERKVAKLAGPLLRWQLEDIERRWRLPVAARPYPGRAKGACLGSAWPEEGIVAHLALEMILHPLEKDGPRGDAVKVPLAALVEVELADGFDHGNDVGVWALDLLSRFLLLEAHRLCSYLSPLLELMLDRRVESGVCQVHFRHELAEERLCSLQSRLQGLYVLRCRVPATVRRFIVCTV